MGERVTFSFGRNWQRYLKSLDGDRVRNAEGSLVEFLGLPDLAGKSFIDLGCGSGLFSFAAFKLGARRVVSIDIDPCSVSCCASLREREGRPERWTVVEGSALDAALRSKFGTFDIVYSWGVLHHTGAMWRALENAGRLVADGGCLYIALYNRVDGRRGSGFWLGVKRLYNRVPAPGKRLMEWAYMGHFIAARLIRCRNPLREIRDYKSCRGMSWRTDISDWLGGYPYEFATVEEVFHRVRELFPDFGLENIRSTNGLGNNWFLFRKGPPCTPQRGRG